LREKSVYFLSDAHFHTKDSDWERQKRRRFAAFLETIAGAEHLYLLGDLFDFWFELRRVIPKGYHDILFSLRQLRLTGTGITLLGGNHDYWLGEHLEDELGLALAPDGLFAEHQGRRLLLDHGDESLSGDWAYRALKTVIRNPLFIGAAKLLHPDFTYWAADRLSATSRGIDERQKRRQRPPRHLALRRLLDDSFDALVLGHLHLGFHLRYERWDILCLGDWIERFSYAKLEDGALGLFDDAGRHYPAEAVPDPDGPARDRIRPEGG
jgi:UDP-2,3-diacylglucosamine hydrolase